MILTEFANITATALADGVVTTYKLGGNPGLALLAMFGVVAIFISAIQNMGKLLGQLFIVFIALPIILIEEYKKWRIRK